MSGVGVVRMTGRRTRSAALRLSVLLSLQVVAACQDGSGPNLPPAPPPAPLPITGQEVPELESFDEVIPSLMQYYGIPGGAVAVTYQGRLVYARGYGYADTVAKTTVVPDALFRVASLAKPITATAVMRLVEQGKLELRAKAFSLLPELLPPNGPLDTRVNAITVEQLLWHTGGWDRERTGDPMFQNQTIADVLDLPPPVDARPIIRYMVNRPLDFTPGTAYVYSNFGYAVVGRIIENASGQSYEEFVRSAVLAPAGITRMRLGRTRIADRANGEVRYYDLNQAPSVFPNEGSVPFADGGFYLESMDAHGGWIGSVVDLVRFLTAVDGRTTRADVISETSLETMLTPAPNLWIGQAAFYAMGWAVRPNPGNWWHDGSLPGSTTFFARVGPDVTLAAVFNARQVTTAAGFHAELDPALSQALNGVSNWPAHDLFPAFP